MRHVLGSCRTSFRYGIVLGLLLFALRPLPAPAQCTQPNATISPQAPSDVNIPTTCSGNPIAFFDDFSWRSFISMIWPVQQGMRGVPDPTKDVGPVSGPLVFETLKADWEVFQPSPDGTSPPPAPSPWESYSGQNPCSDFGVKNAGFGDLVLAAFTKFGNLGEAGFGNLVGPLPAQNGTYTRYFTAFNQTEFNQILGQQLYLRSKLPSSGVTFQDGALDIKAAWIDMTNVQHPERYYTRKAWVLNPFATPPTCTQVTVGLVGLHIVRKTPSRPQWIWSTFEQIDNVPGGASTGPFAYNNGDPSKGMPGSNPNGWPPPATPTVFNVQRLTPIHSSTLQTNQIYQSALKAKGGPWQFYQLVMTQWPVDANAPSEPGTPEHTFPGTGATTAYANVALETFDQTQIIRGCMNCHNTARTTTDFLWALEVNAWPSKIAAPSTPMLALRPSPQAALAAQALPAPLAALKGLMQSGTTH
jgi:hypothetical protein